MINYVDKWHIFTVTTALLIEELNSNLILHIVQYFEI